MVTERLIYIADSNLNILENLKIKEDELSSFLLNAEVIFSKSEKTSNPQIYHLEGRTDSNDKFVCQIILHKDALTCELVPNQFSAKNTKSLLRKALPNPFISLLRRIFSILIQVHILFAKEKR